MNTTNHNPETGLEWGEPPPRQNHHASGKGRILDLVRQLAERPNEWAKLPPPPHRDDWPFGSTTRLKAAAKNLGLELEARGETVVGSHPQRCHVWARVIGTVNQ